MTELIKSETEIRDFLTIPDFVEKTCTQINKDLLGISDAILRFESDNIHPLDGLVNDLVAILFEIKDLEKMAQFIYRIDLNEVDFRKNLDQANWQKLAFLIIRREAQKVFLKHKFK